MAVTIDARPTVFGDRMIVTGTYAAGDNAVDLTGILASIDFAGANSSGIIAARPITDTGGGADVQNVVFAPDVRIDGTTIRIAGGLADGTIGNSAPQQAGTFLAIGRRS
tara:strand:- start:2585 stop:2911 length:327 start_codon:yes stop_codon:yes gene_type:complete